MKRCLLDLACPFSYELTKEAMVICTERSRKGLPVFQEALDSVGYKIRKERERERTQMGQRVVGFTGDALRESERADGRKYD